MPGSVPNVSGVNTVPDRPFSAIGFATKNRLVGQSSPPSPADARPLVPMFAHHAPINSIRYTNHSSTTTIHETRSQIRVKPPRPSKIPPAPPTSTPSCAGTEYQRRHAQHPSRRHTVRLNSNPAKNSPPNTASPLKTPRTMPTHRATEKTPTRTRTTPATRITPKNADVA